MGKQIDYSKVSGVISRLQEILEERGDAQVRIALPGLLARPTIQGLQFTSAKSAHGVGTVEFTPRYDAVGLVNEACGHGSIIRALHETQGLFMRMLNEIVRTKQLLDDYRRSSVAVFDGEHTVQLVPKVKSSFNKMVDSAKEIKLRLDLLAKIDDHFKEVISEPLSASSYADTYEEHIDYSLTDEGFALALADGVGSKTSTQRLAVYLDAARKIDEEIAKRRKRIEQLDKRIEAEGDTSESRNATLLKKKAEDIITVLQNRKVYVRTRFDSLKKSILLGIDRMCEEADKLFAV